MSEAYRPPSWRTSADGAAGGGTSWAGPSEGAGRNAIFVVGLLLAGALALVGLFALLQLGLPSDPGDQVGDLERLDTIKRTAMFVGFGSCLLAVVVAAVLGAWRLRWRSRQVFVPPPGWPTPPDGWRPAAGWAPDPAWPQPPPGWKYWQRHA